MWNSMNIFQERTEQSFKRGFCKTMLKCIEREDIERAFIAFFEEKIACIERSFIVIKIITLFQ